MTKKILFDIRVTFKGEREYERFKEKLRKLRDKSYKSGDINRIASRIKQYGEVFELNGDFRAKEEL